MAVDLEVHPDLTLKLHPEVVREEGAADPVLLMVLAAAVADLECLIGIEALLKVWA